MVHFCSIDDELMNSPDEQLCKLLSYTFMVIAQLIKAMQDKVRYGSRPDQGAQEGYQASKKVLYLIQIPPSLP